MRTGAIFDIRSISKPFTVFVLPFLLIDEGKFALDDPLSKILAGVCKCESEGANLQSWTNVSITIRQMMMHSSGIAEDRPRELEKHYAHVRSHFGREMWLWWPQQPLGLYSRAQSGHYSSSGIAVLGSRD